MKIYFKKYVPVYLSLLLLYGCTSMKISDFETQTPKLDLFDYFDGQTTAWGFFEDRFGTVKRQFRVDIEGVIEDQTLVLTEDFYYDDGEIDQRIWRIQQQDDKTYRGTADDIIGEAKGAAAGNALNWQYTLKLKVKEQFWHVDFNDWMFLQSDNVLLNKAVVTKWGLEVGRVQIFFKKPD